jgi:hemerythrin-like domain-containing protein
VELNISLKDHHKSLSALESIDQDLFRAVIIKYLSQAGKSENDLYIFSQIYIDRLDNLLNSIINDFGAFSPDKLIIMANIFKKLNIRNIIIKIDKIKNIIKNINKYLTKEEIKKSSEKYLNYYFENKGFNFIEESKEYIRNIILNYEHQTDRKIQSDIYWIYNKISEGDTVRKITKKGETIGTVKAFYDELYVITENEKYKLSSAWNKLTTRLNFSEISYDIFKISSRLFDVNTILEKGPIKAEIIKLNINMSYGTIDIPAILIYSPIDNIDIEQIVFAGSDCYGSNEKIVSFYDLCIDFDLKSFSSYEDMLDCFIHQKVLQEMF